MSNSSLEKKTVRPGTLSNYAYYYSDRHPTGEAPPVTEPTAKKPWGKWVALVVVLAVLAVGVPLLRSGSGTDKAATQSTPKATADQKPAVSSDANKAAPAVPAQPADRCKTNTVAGKVIYVGVEARHLWACDGTTVAVDTPVITGLRGDAETETPVGTYKIYGKMQNTTLTGSDSRGSWKYPVYYWMPFLDNQYGTYGFHDATWRDEGKFGNVSPDTTDASHGCVELPLTAQKQLYEWAPVGTQVVVEA